MPSPSRLLWRSIAAALGFLAAVAASLAVIVAATLVPLLAHADLAALPAEIDGVLAIDASAPMRAAAQVVWPGWLALAVLIEIAGLRSLALHFVGFVAVALLGLLGTMDHVPPSMLQVAAAAALVGGFTHWLIAGRAAGLASPAPDLVRGKGDPQDPHA